MRSHSCSSSTRDSGIAGDSSSPSSEMSSNSRGSNSQPTSEVFNTSKATWTSDREHSVEIHIHSNPAFTAEEDASTIWLVNCIKSSGRSYNLIGQLLASTIWLVDYTKLVGLKGRSVFWLVECSIVCWCAVLLVEGDFQFTPSNFLTGYQLIILIGHCKFLTRFDWPWLQPHLPSMLLQSQINALPIPVHLSSSAVYL